VTETDVTTPAPVEPIRRRWRSPDSWRARTDWVPVDTTLGQVLRGLRWGAVTIYIAVAIYYGYNDGLPFGRTDLLFWIAIGLACACIGRHPVWLLWVLVDFLPFAAVLVVYDHLRGISDTIGLATWWKPQIEVDKLLFFGHEPTVWLQEHLKHQRYTGVRWYDIVVCVSYYSFFFLPYVVAGVMWLRSRTDFYRWSLRFVGLSFLGFTLFMLFPAAPPWAAAHCTAADVANHPSSAPCMFQSGPQPSGSLLGAFSTHQPGANPWVERIVGDSFYKLHIGVAHTIWSEGALSADLVAAVPSLHLGGTVLFCLFMWRRVNKWWRAVLIAYPLVMMFSLAYAGEHYVADGIAGALVAWFVHWVATQLELRRKQRRRADTLDDSAPPSDPTQESPCPPIDQMPDLGLPPATTPSSI
jgi:PAP2 superfamily